MLVSSRENNRWNVQSEAFRDLCDRFDGLLSDEPPRPGWDRDLAAFARLFDLEVAGLTPAQIWRRVRTLIVRELDGVHPLPGELPLTPAVRAKIFLPAASRAEAAGGRDSRVLLVVEDDPELAAALVELLCEAGHHVIGPAASAEAASVLAAQHPIDLGIVDVQLDGVVDGVSLANQLRTRWGVPVLFLSGCADNEALIASEAAIGFLGKPFKAHELLAAVTLGTGMLGRRAASTL